MRLATVGVGVWYGGPVTDIIVHTAWVEAAPVAYLNHFALILK